MGAHIVNLLNKPGNEVIVTSRSEHSDTGAIKYIKGNAHEAEFLKRLLKDKYDAIVDFMIYTTKEFSEKCNDFLDATEQYIFLSSSRVYAESESALTEASPRLLETSDDDNFLKSDEYSLAKARQEDILRNCGRKNWTIIRPYITYSSIRLQLGTYEKEKWLFRALTGRPIVFSKELASKYTTLTFGGDVAKIMTELIGNEKATGEVFHITAPQPIKWEKVLDIYSQVLKEKTGTEPDVYMSSEGIGIFKHQYYYDRMYNRVFDNKKIVAAIGGFYEFVNPEEGLKKSLEEFLGSDREFRKIDWKIEAEMDRISGSRIKLQDINDFASKKIYFKYRYIPHINALMLRVKNLLYRGVRFVRRIA